MKKLSKLKLNQLSENELNEREMCRLLGSGTPGNCQCGCNYSASGGSSTSDNSSANNTYGYSSDPTTTAPAQSAYYCSNPNPPTDYSDSVPLDALCNLHP
jgi:natural product precursor